MSKINWKIWPDFKQQDKQGHFIIGFALGLFAVILNPFLTLLIIIIGGVGKEVYDYYHPDNHSCELADCLATICGGIFSAALICFLNL